MNIIEKMYKNAGVEPTIIDACTVEDKYWQNKELANKYGTFDMYMHAKCGQQEDCTTLCSCAYTKEEYPPFTAEKQLELIKFLGKREDFGLNWYTTCDSWSVKTDFRFEYYDETFEHKNFAEALAGLVNQIWKYLKEEERKQIKDILE